MDTRSEIVYSEMVLGSHSNKSVLTSLGVVCLWIGGISGDLYPTARARQHRGPAHRVTRQLVCDGEHAHEIEILVPHGTLTTAGNVAVNDCVAAPVEGRIVQPPLADFGIVPEPATRAVFVDLSFAPARGPPSFS